MGGRTSGADRPECRIWAVRVQRSCRSQVEKRFLSAEELHDLADTIDPCHRTLVLTAGSTARLNAIDTKPAAP
jgi:hypothetical protein